MQDLFQNIESIIWSSKNFNKHSRIVSPMLIKASHELAYMSYGKNLDKLSSFIDGQYYIYGSKQNAQSKPSYIDQIVQFVKNESSIKMLVAVQKASKYIVIISIAGSSADINDWRHNMQLELEDSLHAGFLKNSRDVLDKFRNIQLNELKKELGLSSLSLMDIVQECAMPRSRFCLFFTGHSKGAAIVQILNHILINEYYVCRKNLFSIVFASPSVASIDFLYNTNRYPIININNIDDVISHYGALKHLGCVIEFIPDARHYKFSDTMQSKLLDILRSVHGEQYGFIFLHALIMDGKNIDTLSHLLIPKHILESYVRNLEQYYKDTNASNIDIQESKILQANVSSIYKKCNIKDTLHSIYEYIECTHKLYAKYSPYQHFVNKGYKYNIFLYKQNGTRQKFNSFIHIANTNTVIRSKQAKYKNRGTYESKIKRII